MRTFGSLKKDFENFLAKEKVKTAGNDATEMLQALQVQASEDSDFQYRYSVDGEGRLQHLLWVTGEGKRLFQRFGDVVLFDTTYK